MKKRLLCLILAAVLCGLPVGCGAARKPAVTIVVKVPFLQMMAHTGCDVVTACGFLREAANAFAEQYDAADVLYEGYFNMSTCIHTGRAVPLDDIIRDDLRADIPWSFWVSSQFNGRTYMLPFLSLQNTTCFNAELFRQAGLKEFVTDDPQTMQNWTREEWEYILQTLKENLPDLISPMMMYAGTDQGDTHILTLLRCFGCSFFGEDGRVHVNTPEGIAALRWIKECNDKGYFLSGADTLIVTDCYDQFIHGMLAI